MRSMLAFLALLFALPASADPDRCLAGLTDANRDVALAQRVSRSAVGTAEVELAKRLSTAADAQTSAALALCDAPRPNLPTVVDPFEVDAAPAEEAVLPLIPVPGVPYLADPAVESGCPGPECRIVIVMIN